MWNRITPDRASRASPSTRIGASPSCHVTHWARGWRALALTQVHSTGAAEGAKRFRHWSRDWRALALTQVHNGSPPSDSHEGGEALSSPCTRPPAPQASSFTICSPSFLQAEHLRADPGHWKYGTQPVMQLLGKAYGWRPLHLSGLCGPGSSQTTPVSRTLSTYTLTARRSRGSTMASIRSSGGRTPPTAGGPLRGVFACL